jgi:cell division protein FtsL
MREWVPWWVIPVAVTFSIVTVWLRLTIVRTTYAVHDVDQNLGRIRQEKEQVQLKVAALRSPKRLETLAHRQFDLFQPRIEQIVYLKKAQPIGN